VRAYRPSAALGARNVTVPNKLHFLKDVRLAAVQGRGFMWAAVVSVGLGMSGCGGGNGSTMSPSPRRLRVTGEVTVARDGRGIRNLDAYLDGKLIGSQGGSDPFGSPSLTVMLGSGSSETAAAVESGSHELAVIVSNFSSLFDPSVPPQPTALYITQSNSHVNVIDTDDRRLLGSGSTPGAANHIQCRWDDPMEFQCRFGRRDHVGAGVRACERTSSRQQSVAGSD
jgi:hypothetical protein